MNTRILTFLALIASVFTLAQNYAEEDIFERTKDDYMIIKSSVDKNIKAEIAPRIEEKIQKALQRTDSPLADHRQIEYARDTLAINEYLNEYNNYFAATTTFGMLRGLQFYQMEYDKLLNKYYKKALERLQPAMKKQLINSQKMWLQYYTSERKFISDLQDFGNHNSMLYSSSYSDKILVDRVEFLVDIYQGNMQGSWTYKE